MHGKKLSLTVLIRSNTEETQKCAVPSKPQQGLSFTLPAESDGPCVHNFDIVKTKAGRKGDPRMHRAVAARLENPAMSLFLALKMGGFDYPVDDDSAVDEANVKLAQRKNQLSRRIRFFKRRIENEETPRPMVKNEIRKQQQRKKLSSSGSTLKANNHNKAKTKVVSPKASPTKALVAGDTNGLNAYFAKSSQASWLQESLQELALAFYSNEIKVLYERVLLQAGFPPENARAGSPDHLDFAWKAWQQEGQRLRKLMLLEAVRQEEEEEKQRSQFSENQAPQSIENSDPLTTTSVPNETLTAIVAAVAQYQQQQQRSRTTSITSELDMQDAVAEYLTDGGVNRSESLDWNSIVEGMVTT